MTRRKAKEIRREQEAAGVVWLEVVALLRKEKAKDYEMNIKYIGFEITNDFVVGYGLDYEGYGRNLKDIYKLKQ